MGFRSFDGSGNRIGEVFMGVHGNSLSENQTWQPLGSIPDLAMEVFLAEKSSN